MMLNELEGRGLKNEKRLLKLLQLSQNEAEAQITYYTVDKICDKLNLPVPPQKSVINKLKEDGFRAVLTHFNSRGVRTDAPANMVTETIKALAPKSQ